MLKLLEDAMRDLNEPLVLELVNESLAKSVLPLDIVEQCRLGLVEVGNRYSQGNYFLGDLILSSEIFSQVMDIINPILTPSENRPIIGKIVIGTVEGDIHDIGKNIEISLLRCYGFEVYDVGVDVPPDKFILALTETQAPILCLYTLLSPCFETLKRTISLVRLVPQCSKSKILIGGLVNERVRAYTGADAWVDDARKAVDICLGWTGQHST